MSLWALALAPQGGVRSALALRCAADLRCAIAPSGRREVQALEITTLRDRLGVWIRAGIISPDQAERILELEAPSGGPGPAGPSGRAVGSTASMGAEPHARTERRAQLAEAIGYVGAAFAIGALGLLVAEFWTDLAVWARISLSGILGGLAVAAGALLRGRGARASGRREGAIDRLVGVLWALGVIATAWVAAIVAAEVLTLADDWEPTFASAVAAVVAALLLLAGRHILVQLTLFLALGSGVAATFLALAPLEFGALAAGTLLLGGGATWALAGAGGWLGPRVSAEVTGVVFVLIGTQVLSGSTAPIAGLVVGIVAAAALVVLSLLGGRPHLLYLGAFGLFLNVPRLVFELFADTFGAPATLLTTGLLLILIAVGIGRIRRSQEVHDV